MSSADDYRTNAEDCLRMAKTAAEERDRPLWATMAQSWLRLAEHAERVEPTAADATDAAEHVEGVTLAPVDYSDAADQSDEDAGVSPRTTN